MDANKSNKNQCCNSSIAPNNIESTSTTSTKIDETASDAQCNGSSTDEPIKYKFNSDNSNVNDNNTTYKDKKSMQVKNNVEKYSSDSNVLSKSNQNNKHSILGDDIIEKKSVSLADIVNIDEQQQQQQSSNKMLSINCLNAITTNNLNNSCNAINGIDCNSDNRYHNFNQCNNILTKNCGNLNDNCDKSASIAKNNTVKITTDGNSVTEYNVKKSISDTINNDQQQQNEQNNVTVKKNNIAEQRSCIALDKTYNDNSIANEQNDNKRINVDNVKNFIDDKNCRTEKQHSIHNEKSNVEHCSNGENNLLIFSNSIESNPRQSIDGKIELFGKTAVIDNINDGNQETSEINQKITSTNGVDDQQSLLSKESTSTSLTMDDDCSMRTPLLGNIQQNGNYDYNSIGDGKIQRRRASVNGKGRDINEFNLDDSKIKKVLYNDYVNLLCDVDVTKVPNHEQQQQQQDGDGRSSGITTTKPENVLRRKSIQKPLQKRLSIACTGNDPDRPVLHVQFLSQNSQSRSLDLPDNDKDGKPPSPPPFENYLPPKQPTTILKTSSQYQTNNPNTNITEDLSESPSSDSSSSSESSSSDDESSIDQIAEAKPPDGGWGWVIVFASFMVNLIADGITFSFGVIYVELLKYFGEGKAKTAWIGSLFMAMPLLSGPIASFLTDRYGCRRVTIAGSILASIGFFLSSFTDSIEMLCFTFGVFAGFGLSLCYVAAVVIVAYYFDKRRSFATGLSVCGSGIGTFLFAPLTQFLIDEYGWRGTTLILSGLFLNMTVCGLLMRDLEWTTYKSKQKAKLKKKRSKLGISAESFSVSNSTNTGGTTSNLQKDDGNDMDRSDENGDSSLANQSSSYEDDPRLYSSLITLPTFVKNGEKVPVEVLELFSANRNISNVLLKNYPSLAHSRSFSQPLTTSRHPSAGIVMPNDSTLSPTNHEQNCGDGTNTLNRSKNRRVRNEQAFLKWLKEGESIRHPKDSRMAMRTGPHNTAAYLKDLRMHRHSLTYRGAMLNINRYRLRASSCPDIYRNSMTTIAKEKTQWGQGVAEFKAVLVDMLDFSFFSDIRFTLFALSNFLLYTWYDVPYVYLADYAGISGYSEKDASMLISMIGIINMFGEIILGWLGDRKFVTAGSIYAICMLFCGIVTGFVPLVRSYWGLSTLSGLFGLFIAANYALTSIILVELITLDRFTNAYGLLLLVQGIANLIGPPLAGWITDETGSYNLAFYLAGIFIVISGFFMLICPIRRRIQKYRYNGGWRSTSYDEGEESDDEDSDVENGPNKNNANNVLASKSTIKFDITKNNLYGEKYGNQV